MLHGRAEHRDRIRNSIRDPAWCSVCSSSRVTSTRKCRIDTIDTSMSKFWPSTDGRAEHGDRILRSIPDPAQSSIWSSSVVAQSCKMNTIDTTKCRYFWQRVLFVRVCTFFQSKRCGTLPTVAVRMERDFSIIWDALLPYYIMVMIAELRKTMLRFRRLEDSHKILKSPYSVSCRDCPSSTLDILHTFRTVNVATVTF